MHHWLMKSEPDEFSFQELERKGKEPWTGVRNYQARNFMRSAKADDLVLFYHSNCNEPGIVGVAKVSKEAFDDPTQFEPKSDYYDVKSTKENPRWSLLPPRLQASRRPTGSPRQCGAQGHAHPAPRQPSFRHARDRR